MVAGIKAFRRSGDMGPVACFGGLLRVVGLDGPARPSATGDSNLFRRKISGSTTKRLSGGLSYRVESGCARLLQIRRLSERCRSWRRQRSPGLAARCSAARHLVLCIPNDGIRRGRPSGQGGAIGLAAIHAVCVLLSPAYRGTDRPLARTCAPAQPGGHARSSQFRFGAYGICRRPCKKKRFLRIRWPRMSIRSTHSQRPCHCSVRGWQRRHSRCRSISISPATARWRWESG